MYPQILQSQQVAGGLSYNDAAVQQAGGIFSIIQLPCIEKVFICSNFPLNQCPNWPAANSWICFQNPPQTLIWSFLKFDPGLQDSNLVQGFHLSQFCFLIFWISQKLFWFNFKPLALVCPTGTIIRQQGGITNASLKEWSRSSWHCATFSSYRAGTGGGGIQEAAAALKTINNKYTFSRNGEEFFWNYICCRQTTAVRENKNNWYDSDRTPYTSYKLEIQNYGMYCQQTSPKALRFSR